MNAENFNTQNCFVQMLLEMPSCSMAQSITYAKLSDRALRLGYGGLHSKLLYKSEYESNRVNLWYDYICLCDIDAIPLLNSAYYLNKDANSVIDIYKQVLNICRYNIKKLDTLLVLAYDSEKIEGINIPERIYQEEKSNFIYYNEVIKCLQNNGIEIFDIIDESLVRQFPM